MDRIRKYFEYKKIKNRVQDVYPCYYKVKEEDVKITGAGIELVKDGNFYLVYNNVKVGASDKPVYIEDVLDF